MRFDMRKRKFRGGVVNHVYQRTVNRFNIFYDEVDCLVYFTMFCTFAKEAGIVVWGLCLMVDHIHMMLQADRLSTMSKFISRVTSVFVREYNKDRSRSGSLFDERYGSAPKSDKKHLMTCLIYLGNNPVEKSLCIRAEEFKWNFIAYSASRNPFSDKVSKRGMPLKMKKAMSVVDSYSEKGKYLDYFVLDRIFSSVTKSQKAQLIDYIICRYNIIDYSRVLSHFDSYEQMCVAMRSTTGSEYDIKEHRDVWSDSVYADFIKCLNDSGLQCVRKVIMMRIDEKIRLAQLLHRSTGAPFEQVCKFLHLKHRKE